MCTGPHTFQHLYGLVLGRMSERSSCGALFGNVRILDVDFADDDEGALEVLNEDSEPLEFLVSWVKTKNQAFKDIFDAAILSVPVCGEDVEVMERFTYLGSDIHVSAGCEAEVNRDLGWAWGVMDALDHGVWCCR